MKLPMKLKINYKITNPAKIYLFKVNNRNSTCDMVLMV